LAEDAEVEAVLVHKGDQSREQHPVYFLSEKYANWRAHIRWMMQVYFGY
jgi:hypothetical protein